MILGIFSVFYETSDGSEHKSDPVRFFPASTSKKSLKTREEARTVNVVDEQLRFVCRQVGERGSLWKPIRD
jgi:hypothetical protein